MLLSQLWLYLWFAKKMAICGLICEVLLLILYFPILSCYLQFSRNWLSNENSIFMTSSVFKTRIISQTDNAIIKLALNNKKKFEIQNPFIENSCTMDHTHKRFMQRLTFPFSVHWSQEGAENPEVHSKQSFLMVRKYIFVNCKMKVEFLSM